MCSPSPPPTPDYSAAAKEQGIANVEAARTSAKLSNPNITNPYGSQTVTWGGAPVFDENAYNSALQKYQNDLAAYNSNPNRFGGTVWVNNGGVGDNPGYWENASGIPEPVAPTREQFTSVSNPDQANVTQTLSPVGQALFDQQNRISQGMGNLAESGISRVQDSFSKPFDTSQLPKFIGSIDSLGNDVQTSFSDPKNQIQGKIDSRFDQSGQDVQDALYRKQTAMLDPQYQQEHDALVSQLANQGIMQGSEAYDKAIGNFTRARDAAYNNARDSAILAGGNEQSRLFGLGLNAAQLANTANQQEYGQNLGKGQFNNQAISQRFNQGLNSAQFGNQARQQALQEQSFLRQLPLNEINALRTGAQVNMPQFQQYSGQNVSAAPIMAATQAQNQADIANYNAQAAGSNSFLNGLVGLGSAALMSPAGTFAKFSDVRLKENIVKVGETYGGLPIYTYNYIGSLVPEMGVMAQEVELVNPGAVHTHSSGYKAVDYSKVK